MKHETLFKSRCLILKFGCNDDINIIGNEFLSSFNGDLVLQYVDGNCRPKIYCSNKRSELSIKN